jgi:hypothetical protein
MLGLTTQEAPSTGFRALDRLHPVRVPGTVQLVAGAPGVRVSAWLLAVAGHVAGQQDRGVVYVTGETRDALRRRLILRGTKVDWHRLRVADLDDNDEREVDRVTAQVRRWLLAIVAAADPLATGEGVRAGLEGLADNAPGLVVIDDPTGPARQLSRVDAAALLEMAREVASQRSVAVLVAVRATPAAHDGRDLTRPTLYSPAGWLGEVAAILRRHVGAAPRRALRPAELAARAR